MFIKMSKIFPIDWPIYTVLLDETSLEMAPKNAVYQREQTTQTYGATSIDVPSNKTQSVYNFVYQLCIALSNTGKRPINTKFN